MLNRSLRGLQNDNAEQVTVFINENIARAYYGGADVISNFMANDVSSDKVLNALNALLAYPEVKRALQENIAANGVTLLHAAALNPEYEAVYNKLVDEGFNTAALDRDNRTPIDYKETQAGYSPEHDYEYHDYQNQNRP